MSKLPRKPKSALVNPFDSKPYWSSGQMTAYAQQACRPFCLRIAELEAQLARASDDREAFEEWFKRAYHGRLDRNMPDRSYNDPTANTSWIAWKSRSMLSTTAATQPEKLSSRIEKLDTSLEFFSDEELARGKIT